MRAGKAPHLENLVKLMAFCRALMVGCDCCDAAFFQLLVDRRHQPIKPLLVLGLGSGDQHLLRVRCTQQPPSVGCVDANPVGCIDLGALGGEALGYLANDRELAALLYLKAHPGFPAAVAGVNRGDVITKIGQQPVDSLDVVRRAHAAYAEKPEPVLVEVLRDRQVSLYVLKP